MGRIGVRDEILRFAQNDKGEDRGKKGGMGMREYLEQDVRSLAA
jgi:hypothetical protein